MEAEDSDAGVFTLCATLEQAQGLLLSATLVFQAKHHFS